MTAHVVLLSRVLEGVETPVAAVTVENTTRSLTRRHFAIAKDVPDVAALGRETDLRLDGIIAPSRSGFFRNSHECALALTRRLIHELAGVGLHMSGPYETANAGVAFKPGENLDEAVARVQGRSGAGVSF